MLKKLVLIGQKTLRKEIVVTAAESSMIQDYASRFGASNIPEISVLKHHYEVLGLCVA